MKLNWGIIIVSVLFVAAVFSFAVLEGVNAVEQDAASASLASAA